MREIKRTRTIEEITGYEANDGTYFTTEEECLKYERSAEAAIREMFNNICVKHNGNASFAESEIFENYGYGNEEYEYVIADIKTETELKIANMYCDIWAGSFGKKLKNDSIGKRVLIRIGNTFSQDFIPVGTEEEIVEDFKKTMAKFFRPEANAD